MADIFISYSREDREWVENFASQVQSEGFSVWWDWDLLVGKRYRETIDHELQSCRVAVVVWSQHSVQSDFVRDEAEEAQQRNILVPVLKEIVRPPAGFRQIQTADLSTWVGGGSHAEFRRVMKGIANMVGRPPTVGSAEVTPLAPTPPAPQAAPASAGMAAMSANRQLRFPPGASGPSQLLTKLPPAGHHIWRYIAFGVIALIGVLLIISQFASPTSKVASAVNGNTVVNSNTSGSGNAAGNGSTAGTGNTTPPQAPIPPDAGDIGQTGPRPPAAPAGGNTGDSGDIGQGGTH